MKTTRQEDSFLVGSQQKGTKDRRLNIEKKLLFTEELQLSEEQYKRIARMLAATHRTAPHFWEEEDDENSQAIFVPVKDAELRILHIKPKNPISKRPVVFLPGWGVIPAGFQDFYEVFMA